MIWTVIEYFMFLKGREGESTSGFWERSDELLCFLENSYETGKGEHRVLFSVLYTPRGRQTSKVEVAVHGGMDPSL